MALTLSPLAFLARATVSTSSSTTDGRPPVRPCALAASSPARVRSLMSDRSNSAMAAMIWKNSRPSADVVSTEERGTVDHAEPYASLVFNRAASPFQGRSQLVSQTLVFETAVTGHAAP